MVLADKKIKDGARYSCVFNDIKGSYIPLEYEIHTHPTDQFAADLKAVPRNCVVVLANVDLVVNKAK